MLACQPLEPIDSAVDSGDAGSDLDPREPDTTEPTDTEVDTDLGDGNQEWVRGDLTWSVDFDAVAEAAGRTDCTYVRHYEAGEDTAHDWLCPECDTVYKADVSFVSGRETCYQQVGAGHPIPDELIGHSDGSWMRARSWNSRLTRAGSSTLRGLTWDVQASGSADLPQGALTFTVNGSLDRSRRDGDTTGGFTPPATYACGWPQSAVPAYTGDWTVAVGQPMPDVVLTDICDEPVRLYDLLDGYMVLYSAAADCIMCRDMASGHAAFQAELDALPWDATVVSLLAPALSNADGTPAIPVLSQWNSLYGLQGMPVLRDRGFALYVLGSVYPTSVVVAPDGTVIDIAQGYAGSWDYWGLQIDQHVHGED